MAAAKGTRCLHGLEVAEGAWVLGAEVPCKCGDTRALTRKGDCGAVPGGTKLCCCVLVLVLVLGLGSICKRQEGVACGG